MPKISPVSFRVLVNIFEQCGFCHSRTHGDHLVYVKPGFRRALVIPRYENIPVFIICNLIRTSGITRKKYFEFLKQS